MIKVINKEQIVVNENDKIPLDMENKLIEFNQKTIVALHPKTKKENIIELEQYDGFCATIQEFGDKAYLRIAYYRLYELEE